MPPKLPNSPKYLYKKHQRGSAFTAKEKQLILNVYSFFRQSCATETVRKVASVTAAACGISVQQVYVCKKEQKNVKDGTISGLKDGRKKGSKPDREHLKVYPEWAEGMLRNKIHREFFMNNIPPTLRKVHEAIKNDPILPNITITGLHRVLLRIGFIYRSRKRNSVLMERPDITEWRHRFLRAIRKHRRDGRTIVYSDETWVNAGHVRNKTWQDSTIKTYRQSFLEGLSTGLKQPSGKGERLIITHAGTPDGGFIPNAELIFRAKKQDGDYHGEMNSELYEHWFTTKLIPNIPPNSIIVLDNAPYHTAKVELLPRKGWKKQNIRDWLTSKNIAWDGDMIIAELLKLVEPHRKKYDARRLDKIANEAGHTILWLPPYHCELNIIELVC